MCARVPVGVLEYVRVGLVVNGVVDETLVIVFVDDVLVLDVPEGKLVLKINKKLIKLIISDNPCLSVSP